MTSRFRLILVASVGILVLLQSAGAHQTFAGANFTVNSAADSADAVPGDGACTTLAGQCTLRAAIQETNALAGTTDATGIRELPVSFRVVNSNTSGYSCPSDFKEYTVRGHLVGPAAALESQSPAVTFYLYGFEGGEFHWRMTEELAGVSGYDWPLEMAKLGHVSLTIDMLGYDSSVTPEGPHGFLNCWGSQADVAHQIVGQLKNGQYSVDGRSGNGVSFAKVVLAGHDAGATVAEIEAYSYKDIDGLMTVEMADQGFSQYILNLFAEKVAFCATTGGEDREKESDPPVGPGGYFHLPPLDDWKTVLFQMDNSDERVVDAAIALRNRNPCAWELTAAGAFPVNRARLHEVDVPVLLEFPLEDPIFTQEGREQQRGNYCPEPEPLTNCDVEVRWLANTGHFPMLEKSVGQFRGHVSDWLCSRGLVSAPSGNNIGACG
jgi:CSLREA domain-containing protein